MRLAVLTHRMASERSRPSTFCVEIGRPGLDKYSTAGSAEHSSPHNTLYCGMSSLPQAMPEYYIVGQQQWWWWQRNTGRRRRREWKTVYKLGGYGTLFLLACLSSISTRNTISTRNSASRMKTCVNGTSFTSWSEEFRVLLFPPARYDFQVCSVP